MPKYDFLIILTGHWGYYFQHFFDNIGPQMALLFELLGIPPNNNMTLLVETSHLFPAVPDLWKRIGFQKIISASLYNKYSAKFVAMVESCPRIHPDFYKLTRKFLHLPRFNPKFIIWIQRKPTNSYFAQRFILNENETIAYLKKKYGSKNFLVYDHSKYSLNETINLFSKAKVLIGVHGGGLYNQFYASPNAAIVEIMPVKKNGLYPDQPSKKAVPSFSHMAVWSNSILIGQQFWRYYEITNASNFNLSIPKFTLFLSKIPALNDFEDEKISKIDL